MGLDMTLYMAQGRPSGFFNPFAPEPPEGKHWAQITEWRRHYSMRDALFPGAGSPDWKVLTREDIDRALHHMALPDWHEVLSPPDDADPQGHRRAARKRINENVLRLVARYIDGGDIFLLEVVS